MYLSLYLSVYLYIYLSIDRSICRSILIQNLSLYLSVYLSIDLSIDLFLYTPHTHTQKQVSLCPSAHLSVPSYPLFPKPLFLKKDRTVIFLSKRQCRENYDFCLSNIMNWVAENKVEHCPCVIQTSFVPTVRRVLTVSYRFSRPGNLRCNVCLCGWDPCLWCEGNSFISVRYKLPHRSAEHRRRVYWHHVFTIMNPFRHKHKYLAELQYVNWPTCFLCCVL
jgi:hypothetical protein